MPQPRLEPVPFDPESHRASQYSAALSSIFSDLPLTLKQEESDNADEEEPLEEEGEVDDMRPFNDEKFDPEFRVSTWEQTILGKPL